MKLRKVIKHIAAIGAGVTMVGATIFGAMAADLANYPAPFVEGTLLNTVLVVGDKAAAEDVIGISDIAASLQYVLVAGSSGNSDIVSTKGEVYKVEKDSDKLNLGEYIYKTSGDSVLTTSISKDELPNLLADGTFRNKAGNEYGYEQKITFGDGTLQLTHFADNDYNDKEPTIGVKVAKKAMILNYRLDFKKDVESINTSGDLTDLENKKITILGQEYDIIDALQGTTTSDTKLVLMKGSLQTTMEEGETKTFTINGVEYEVNVAIITDSGDQQVKFVINGETTDALQASQTYKLADGSQIGVREILANEAGDVTQDIVEFYLGADKLTLENGQTMEISDEDEDDVKVTINRNDATTKVKITDIYLNWTPQSEETFIVGYSLPVFPGLGSVKLFFEGMTYPTNEVIQLENNGDKSIELKVPISGGGATIPLVSLNSGATNITLIGGDDSDEVLITSPDNDGTVNSIVIDTDTDEYFVVTSVSGKESHLMELSSVKNSSAISYATFKDVLSGTKYEDQRIGSTFNVGEVSIAVDAIDSDGNNATITVTGYMDRIISEGGMTILLPWTNTTARTLNSTTYTAAEACTFLEILPGQMGYTQDVTYNEGEGYTTTTCTSTPDTYNVIFKEDDKTEGTTTTDTTDGKHIAATIGITSSKIQVSSVNTTDYEIGDSDVYEGYTIGDLATKTLRDTNGDQDKLELIYHGGESYGNFYIGTEGSSVVVSEGSSESIIKIDVGAILLASEVVGLELTQNMILVGGPCANAATAVVMGNPKDCAAGFEDGKGIIQLFENNGNVAMVVAGMTARDTRAASAVVANYVEYDLSGEKMEVTTETKSVKQVEVVKAPALEDPAVVE